MRLTDYLLIAAIGIIIYLLFFRPASKPQPSDRERRLYDSMRIYKDSARIYSERSKENKKVVDSVNEVSKKADQKYRASEKKMVAREKELRSTIQLLIDSRPHLQSYIAFRDSIDSVKDIRITDLGKELLLLDSSYTSLNISKDAEIRARDRLLAQAEGIIQEKNKQLKTQKKRATIKTIVISIGTALVTWVVTSALK